MIAITGATGFLGSHLVSACASRKIAVRCLIRPRSPRADRLHASRAVTVETDFNDEASLAAALAGCDTVIHALGLINGTDEALRKANVECTRNVVAAARKAGVARFLFISSVAAIRRHGAYGESKFGAEEEVRKSGIAHLMLRPAFIYGPRDENNTGLLIRTLKRWPLIPLLGGGGFKLQPVYVGDVVDLILKSLEAPFDGRIYNVAGPRQVALKEMLELLGQSLGLKRVFVPIPLRPVQALVRIYLSVFKNTRLPAKQILELNKHEAFDISGTERDLGFRPMDFREGAKLCAAS
ncbi:MAG: NAD-dependent epimerase/dehydratase family protein [Candidatus Omnitrophica bacterium]|nr:NAD-dependent epimerase/dehydratase family protein [Candidatus Omnitrophota bacterium]